MEGIAVNFAKGSDRQGESLRVDEEDQLLRSTEKEKAACAEGVGLEVLKGNGGSLNQVNQGSLPVRVENNGEVKMQNPRGVVTYRDLLIGINGKNNGMSSDEEEERFWDIDEFSDDDEGHESLSMKGGETGDLICPVILVSKEEIVHLCKPFKKVIIIKLLGRRMGYKFLLGCLQKLWSLTGTFTMVRFGNEFFIVRFTSNLDYHFVMNQGPWMIAGHYLLVQHWCPEFNPFDETHKKLAVWIRIPELPL